MPTPVHDGAPIPVSPSESFDSDGGQGMNDDQLDRRKRRRRSDRRKRRRIVRCAVYSAAAELHRKAYGHATGNCFSAALTSGLSHEPRRGHRSESDSRTAPSWACTCASGKNASVPDRSLQRGGAFQCSGILPGEERRTSGAHSGWSATQKLRESSRPPVCSGARRSGQLYASRCMEFLHVVSAMRTNGGERGLSRSSSTDPPATSSAVH